MNVWLKLTMDDFVYVFDAWRKWSYEVICVWPRTNSDTITDMFIWFCYLEWMSYGDKLIWCNLLTLKSQRNSLGLGPRFCQQNKQVPLKMIICAKLSIVSRILHTCVKYSIVTSCLHLLYLLVYKLTPVSKLKNWVFHHL